MQFLFNKKWVLVLGITAIVLPLAIFLNSCNKEVTASTTKETENVDGERMKKVVLSEYNQKLLNKFLEETKKYFKESGLDLRSADGRMLAFNSEASFNSYNQSLGTLSSAWDASNGVPIPAGNSFALTENPGNPALNAVDAALDFQSTYYDYAYRRELSGSRNLSLSSGEPEVGDPYFQHVMNLNEEVEIGGSIFKQLENHTIAKIPVGDSDALNSVRILGAASSAVNLQLLDEDNGGAVPRSPVLPRGACSVTISGKEQKGMSTPTTVIYEFRYGAELSPAQQCGGDIKVEYGDGSYDEDKGGFKVHAYQVNRGDTKTFKVKATFTGIGLGACATCIGESSKELPITITNNEPCNDRIMNERPEHYIGFQGSQGGNTVNCCITTRFGFRGEGNFWSKAKVWLNTTLEVQKSNGRWTSARPASPILLDVYKFLRTNNCGANLPVNFEEGTLCSYFELIRTTSNGIPSTFGVFQNDRNMSLWGKVRFGGLVYDKPYWEW